MRWLRSQIWLQSCACLVDRLGCELGHLSATTCSLSPSVRLDLIIASTYHVPDCTALVYVHRKPLFQLNPKEWREESGSFPFFETESH